MMGFDGKFIWPGNSDAFYESYQIILSLIDIH